VSAARAARPSGPDEGGPSGPVEDYLKAIYEIELGTGAAATNDIAQRLAIAPASVSGMVRRLAEQGMVEYERYRGVRLTASGRLVALRTLRRHRVIEAYLVRALGYEWDRVHEEAERLEHAASEELIDRMAAAVGEPRTDPHGAPIPTREGAVDETRYPSLAELPVGEDARVVRVSDEDGEMLRYLAELGLRPGAAVRVLDRAPYEGPITLRVADTECAVGPGLAGQVLIQGTESPDEQASSRTGKARSRGK
jgi:DtxR family transcriptional regulator, Mn-dependent transcriptional regulator